MEGKNYIDPTLGKLNALYNTHGWCIRCHIWFTCWFWFLFPNTELMLLFPPIPIKAKYFVIGYAAIELYLGMQNSPSDNVAHFAHLGGALIGIIIVLYWQKTEIVFLMSLIDQLKYQFNTGGTYLKIIYINVGVFIVFLLLNVFSALMKASNMIDIVPLFELNSSPSDIFI